MLKFFQKKHKTNKVAINANNNSYDTDIRKSFYKDTHWEIIPDSITNRGEAHALHMGIWHDSETIEMLTKEDAYKEFPLDKNNKLRETPVGGHVNISSALYTAFYLGAQSLKVRGYKWLYQADHKLYSGYFVDNELIALYKTYIGPEQHKNTPSSAMLTTTLVPLAETKPLYYYILYPLNESVSDLTFDKEMSKNVPTRKLLREFSENELRSCVQDYVANYGLTLKHLSKIKPECLKLLVEQKETVCLLVKHDMATFDQLCKLNRTQLAYLLNTPNEEAAQNFLYNADSSRGCFVF